MGLDNNQTGEREKMTELYKRIIKHATEKDDDERLALSHKVWDPTPFVIDVYMGEIAEFGMRTDERTIREYCRGYFGKESWPIHDEPADWYRGGATVDGWTWFGFKTKEMMDKFIFDWPENTKQDKK